MANKNKILQCCEIQLMDSDNVIRPVIKYLDNQIQTSNLITNKKNFRENYEFASELVGNTS